MDVVREAAEIFLKDVFPLSSGLDDYFVPGIVREVVKLMIDLEIFGDAPMVYQVLEQSLASNDSTLFVQGFYEMFVFLAHTNASGFDLLSQLLPRMFNTLRPLFSLLTPINGDLEVFGNLTENIAAMLVQIENTFGLMAPMEYHGSMIYQNRIGGNYSGSRRRRREALPPSGGIMEDFSYLYDFDYLTLFKAISVPPTTKEIMETIHVFFSNPDLQIVLKQATKDVNWGLNASREDIIDAVLGMGSFLTLPHAFLT